MTDFDRGDEEDDDDDDFGFNVKNKSLSLSPSHHHTTTATATTTTTTATSEIHADGGGSAVDGDHTPMSDTWKNVGVGQEENTMVDTDSSSLPLPILTSMSLT